MLIIRKYADKWNIDPQKIAVNGYSAGGHLAASIGTLYNEPWLCDMFKTTPENLRPDVMVLAYPVISSDSKIVDEESIVNLTGQTDPENELYKWVSLENRVHKNTPAAYIWHTSDDDNVKVENSLVFANALAANGIKFELHIFQHGPHGLATATRATKTNLDRLSEVCSVWIKESVDFLNSIWEK